jgi:glycerol-3-phosphate dehydrogenase
LHGAKAVPSPYTAHNDPESRSRAKIGTLSSLKSAYGWRFRFADVRAAFAAVRPLVASKGAVHTKKLVRDHEVEVDAASGLISILGGKWTTYRAMAEDGVDHVMLALGDAHVRATTADLQLTGAEGFSPEYWKTLMEKFGISAETARHLAETLGADAPHVLDVVRSAPEFAEPLFFGSPVLAGEVVYSIREEMAQSIEDVLARRVGIQFHNWSNAVKAAPAVGRLLGRELGWSSSAVNAAVEEYAGEIEHLARRAGVSLASYEERFVQVH